jgi:endonuclease/exonuclease/phosphatase family metal-dependent hydrolase
MRGFGILSPNVFVRGLIVIATLLFLQLPSFAKSPDVAVGTLNLYIGADIESLANAPNIGAFLAGAKEALDQVVDNDFTERAEALAALIIEKDLEIVGLQEVYVFTSEDPELNGSPPFLDYLEELKEALSAQGACYNDVATVTNFNFGPVPVDFYGWVTLTDRDVILARCDVDTVPVDLKSMCPRPSDVKTDVGCTYVKTASTTILGEGPFPDIKIEIKRGYVAVDVIGNFPFRLFNTHLEVRNPDPAIPASSFFQAAQASELINIIGLIPPSEEEGPVIIVGDINSSPEDVQTFSWEPPYMQLAAENYDAWTLRPGKPKGFTCCFDEDLSIPADLYERIDVIFSDEMPTRVKANVIGNDEADQTASGLWPSDHAGVAARINF